MTLRTGQIAFGVLVLVFAACTFLGGSNRWDMPSLLILRPVGALCLGAGLFLLTLHRDDGGLRTLMWLLAAFAGLMLLQLVPLPPAWWRALPGHAIYLDPMVVSQVGEPWRPLTLSPDRTINALLTLVFPATVIAAYAATDRAWHRWTVLLVIAITALSAVLGILQLAAGAKSPFYLYAIHHDGWPVGIFANRNHHAALLAVALPMLRMWTLLPARSNDTRVVRNVTAAGLGLFFFAVSIATGSRAGLVASLLGMIGAVLIAPFPRSVFAGWRGPAMIGGVVTVFAALAVSMFVLGRGAAFDRAIGRAIEEEGRVRTFPTIIQLIRDHLPWGGGFGSFETSYRVIEPDALLLPSYLNHAHNDFLELAYDGGVPAILLALAFGLWLMIRIVKLARAGGAHDRVDVALGRLGAVVVVILLAASVVDYPLRTPFVAALFALACCWVQTGARTRPNVA